MMKFSLRKMVLSACLVFFGVILRGTRLDARMKLRTRKAPPPYSSFLEMRGQQHDRVFFEDVKSHTPIDSNRWDMYRSENYKNHGPRRRTLKEKQSTVSKILRWFFD